LKQSSDGQEQVRGRLESDYRESLKARDSARVSVIRMLKAAVQNSEKAKGSPLSEAEWADVINREVKLRRESLAEFERGRRGDLASTEARALKILAEYSPPQLSEDEIREIVDRAIEGMDAAGLENPKSALGLVMRTVMPQVHGRADGSVVNDMVRSALSARSRQGL